MGRKRHGGAARQGGDGVVLVQTKVPGDLAEWLRGVSQREGITASAYLRRLLIRDRERVTLGAGA